MNAETTRPSSLHFGDCTKLTDYSDMPDHW